MSRPRKAVVDYFPHDVYHGRAIFTIDNKYGNDGYACWFKLLELLGATEHHFLDCNELETWEFLLAKTRLNEDTVRSILNTCSKLGAIDQLLWDNKIIRSNEFLESLDILYKRREISIYSNNEVLSFCKQKSHSLGVTANSKPQSKVKDSKADNSKLDETRAEERIVKENPNPNPSSGSKNNQPRKEEIQIHQEIPKPNPEAVELVDLLLQRNPRARAHERELLLEDEYNLGDLIGVEPEQEPEFQEPVNESGLQEHANPNTDHERITDLETEPDKRNFIKNKGLIIPIKEVW